jgi:leucyl aminopeptidase
MHFDLWSTGLATRAVECIVLGAFERGKLEGVGREIDERAGGAIGRAIDRGDFAGRAGDTLLLTEIGGLKASRVLLVGLGVRKSWNRRAWRRALIAAVGALARTRVRTAALALERPQANDFDDYVFARSSAELVSGALYRVNDLKTAKKPRAPALEAVHVGPVPKTTLVAARRGLEHGAAIAVGQAMQRDLANLPPNLCTPAHLARRARELAARYRSLRTRVFDLPQIRRLGMGCFLAVAQGSSQPPKFIILEHRGGKAGAAPVVLVGKGVTFDSGGISLKDPGGMDEMKFDMSGAAAVLAAMRVVAELALPLHVVALVPACENMPGGRAVKPGDVVTSASGQTVEILNTDAEGRLILADALHYAKRYQPAAVIDVATLTGACVVALGAHHSGLFTKDEALAQELLESGRRADDRAWRMPLTEEYFEALKSNFADFANVGGREGGASVAASFLEKFTQGLAWAHLDIAGTAYQSGAQKGSTGRPIPLLSDFLIGRAARRP